MDSTSERTIQRYHMRDGSLYMNRLTYSQKTEAWREAPVFILQYSCCLASRSGGRLLLGNAVDIATPQQDLAAWDLYDLALGEAALKNLQGFGIFRDIERWCDDGAVDDQEVDVRRRQTLA